MPKYYCHECSIKRKLLDENYPLTNLTGSSDQLGKFIKHTSPTQSYDVNSIFNDKDYSDYKNYIINTLASGSVEVDDYNRKNIVYCAGKTIGFTFIKGSIQIPADAVKVVLHQDDYKIHSYPTSSIGFMNEICSNCGKSIIK
ncbi:MAG: hypothetical protein KJ799_10070 [Bacteroidetes bacterium]|nr:hypothetical protein [Bacteroidota bacterium]